MMTLEEIQKGLADRRLPVVAQATGLHYNTVRKYALGEIVQPSHNAITRLSEYLSK